MKKLFQGNPCLLRRVVYAGVAETNLQLASVMARWLFSGFMKPLEGENDDFTY